MTISHQPRWSIQPVAAEELWSAPVLTAELAEWFAAKAATTASAGLTGITTTDEVLLRLTDPRGQQQRDFPLHATDEPFVDTLRRAARWVAPRLGINRRNRAGQTVSYMELLAAAEAAGWTIAWGEMPLWRGWCGDEVVGPFLTRDVLIVAHAVRWGSPFDGDPLAQAHEQWVMGMQPEWDQHMIPNHQLAIAQRLAAAFGHEWATVLSPVEEDGPRRWNAASIAAYVEEHSGHYYAGIRCPHYLDSVITHTTGTGRTAWEVTPGGTVNIVINRPEGTVLELSLHGMEPNRYHITRDVPFHERHVAAMWDVVNAFYGDDDVPAAVQAVMGRFEAAAQDEDPSDIIERWFDDRWYMLEALIAAPRLTIEEAKQQQDAIRQAAQDGQSDDLSLADLALGRITPRQYVTLQRLSLEHGWALYADAFSTSRFVRWETCRAMLPHVPVPSLGRWVHTELVIVRVDEEGSTRMAFYAGPDGTPIPLPDEITPPVYVQDVVYTDGILIERDDRHGMARIEVADGQKIRVPLDGVREGRWMAQRGHPVRVGAYAYFVRDRARHQRIGAMYHVGPDPDTEIAVPIPPRYYRGLPTLGLNKVYLAGWIDIPPAEVEEDTIVELRLYDGTILPVESRMIGDIPHDLPSIRDLEPDPDNF